MSNLENRALNCKEKIFLTATSFLLSLSISAHFYMIISNYIDNKKAVVSVVTRRETIRDTLIVPKFKFSDEQIQITFDTLYRSYPEPSFDPGCRYYGFDRDKDGKIEEIKITDGPVVATRCVVPARSRTYREGNPEFGYYLKFINLPN
jgi:hypothetical protein